MFNGDAFVLTVEQLKAAVLRGCGELGYVPGGSGISGDFELTVVVNGAVLTFGESEDLAYVTHGDLDRASIGSELDTSHMAETGEVRAQMTVASEAEVTELKGLLVQVMDRCPSVATIRAWGPDQKAKAKSWAKKWLKSAKLDIPRPERPAFIVEPQPRTRVKAIAPQGDAVEMTSPAPNGSAVSSSRRRAFFDEADAEAPGPLAESDD